MKFCKPNLPQKKVTSVFCSEILPDDIKTILNKSGIITEIAPKCKELNSELSYHPDITLNNPKMGLWYTVGKENVNKSLTKGDAVLYNKYPYDCMYNCFIINNTLYGGKAVAQEIIKHAKRRVIVAQGYAKCSTVILSEQDFITSDPSIYKALTAERKNVLKVTNDGILLNGFSCGFIGGCTGVLGNKTLAILGDAKKLSDYKIIRDFCADIGYTIISLSNKQPYDYGGLLPIAETD